jgi:hypothetical protein
MTSHRVGHITSAIAVLAVVAAVAAAAQQPPPPAPSSRAVPSPTDVFLSYRAALVKATSYAELLPFMEAQGRATIEALPEQQRAGMFDLLKKFAGTFTEVSVTKEAITDDSAVLTLAGRDPKGQPATGTVPMSREADGWKVGTEKWSSRPR